MGAMPPSGALWQDGHQSSPTEGALATPFSWMPADFLVGHHRGGKPKSKQPLPRLDFTSGKPWPTEI